MVCWSGMGAAICKLSVKLSRQVKRRSSGKRGNTNTHTHSTLFLYTSANREDLLDVLYSAEGVSQ